jgi:hypothetical protein
MALKLQIMTFNRLSINVHIIAGVSVGRWELRPPTDSQIIISFFCSHCKSHDKGSHHIADARWEDHLVSHFRSSKYNPFTPIRHL